MSLMQRDGHLAALEEILADFKHLDLTGRVELDHPKVPVAQGGFGEVYKGRYRHPDGSETAVAIKCLTVYLDGRRDVIKIFRREIKAWSILQHQNILPLLGYIFEGTEHEPLNVPSLVSKWMPNGGIADFMKASGDSYTKLDGLALDMAQGLAHLHENNVVHADFKPANVLVSEDGRALISDFGSAHVRSDDDFGSVSSDVSGLRGTSRWLAYELLVPSERDPKPTKASDVWAFGMALYELITNDHPYADCLIDAQVLISVMNRELPACPSMLDFREKQLWDICVSCWKCSPVERPSMSDICRTIKFTIDIASSGSAMVSDSSQLDDRPTSSSKLSGPLKVRSQSVADFSSSFFSSLLSKVEKKEHRLPPGFLRFLPSCLHEELLQRHIGISDIQIPHDVRNGGSSDYFVGTHKGDRILVKRVNPPSFNEREVFLKEIEILLAIPPHPNVQTLLGYTEYPYGLPPALVYGHVGGDDVLSFLKERPESDILALMVGIAEGLVHIHSQDVVHGNLRASNIFVESDGQPFITGFACARKLPCDNGKRNVQGSLRWMAPEVMNTEHKNSEIIRKERDVWAFGMTIYELLSGDIPYAEEKYDALVVLDITEGRLPICPLTFWSWSPVRQGIWSICLACWNMRPEARPPMHKLVGALRGLSVL